MSTFRLKLIVYTLKLKLKSLERLPKASLEFYNGKSPSRKLFSFTSYTKSWDKNGRLTNCNSIS